MTRCLVASFEQRRQFVVAAECLGEQTARRIAVGGARQQLAGAADDSSGGVELCGAV